MEREKLILIGGGGHCKSCIDIIENTGGYNIIGILEKPENKGETVLGYPVVGTDSDYQKFNETGCKFLITIGQIKSSEARRTVNEKLLNIGAKLITLVSPRAYVSPHANIGEGSVIMNGVFVNAGAKVGRNCILNTGSIVEHDAVVGDFCHISTQAVVNGDAEMGHDCFVGSNATVSSQTIMGNQVILGAGSLLLKNTGDRQTWVGVPAEIARKREK